MPPSCLCLLGRFRESGKRGDEGLRQQLPQVRQQLAQAPPMPRPWRLQVDPDEDEENELHSSIKSFLSLLHPVPQHQVPCQSMLLASPCCSALCCCKHMQGICWFGCKCMMQDLVRRQRNRRAGQAHNLSLHDTGSASGAGSITRCAWGGESERD